MSLASGRNFTHASEAKALRASILCGSVLGLIGVIWGIASGSQMIILDGVFSVIGILVTWLMLRASALAAEEPSGHYPFGKVAVTPLVVGVQGFVLLGTLGFAAVGAIRSLSDGGSRVSPGPAFAYAVVITVACIVFWKWLAKRAGNSDLLSAEATGMEDRRSPRCRHGGRFRSPRPGGRLTLGSFGQLHRPNNGPAHRCPVDFHALAFGQIYHY